MLLCARPHVKEVDFDTAKFIVSTASGLNVNGQHLIMGDEVPRGVLSVEALRQIYEPPLRLIETVEYTREEPSLVEACTRQGTDISPEPPPPELYEFVEIHNGNEHSPRATQMCDKCGAMFEDLADHSEIRCKRNQNKKRKRNEQTVLLG